MSIFDISALIHSLGFLFCVSWDMRSVRAKLHKERSGPCTFTRISWLMFLIFFFSLILHNLLFFLSALVGISDGGLYEFDVIDG